MFFYKILSFYSSFFVSYWFLFDNKFLSQEEMDYLDEKELWMLAKSRKEQRLWKWAGILCVVFSLVGCWTALHTLDVIPTTSLIAVIGSLYFGNEVGRCIHFYFRNKEVEDAIWNEAMNED